MIDLHAHILPGWDDGAGSWVETRKMCRIAREDGIEKIVATPHVFRLNKQGNDWPALESRFAELARRAPEWGIAVGRGA
ncbi:MAG: capsule biosynthesis protein CapC, partial [Candidatus Lokiarchaeota archaeon]|nr:capsule biosynthesis protein CapC [Candidatus Lokiarchaeota archaeon]